MENNWIDLARKARSIIEKAMQSTSDKQASEVAFLFPRWKSGVVYEAGFRVQHNGVLYSVLQAHTSQDGWTPDVAPSLFAEVLIPDENAIDDWKKPGSTNGYKYGDKVRFNGKVYRSIFEGLNIWSPDEYPAGWELAE